MLVTCACGNSFVTGGSQDELKVDICSKCHPFFTGEQRFVDRQGRVDKFMQRMQAAQAKQASATNTAKKQTKEKKEALSYRQLLQQQKNQIKTDAKSAE